MDKTRMQQYMSQMRAMFNKHALYSDESPQYQIPFEPNPGDTVKIRFRTLKNNVDAVYFISGSTRAQMQVGLVRNGFDYYEIEIPVGNEPIRYFFEIQAGRVVCYYNKLGVTRELQEMYSFGIIPGFHTPDWAKGAVMYQIFVDRFCNGDPSNDVLTGEYSYIGEQVNKVDDWNRFPEQMDVRNFYGGDLQGVIDKMDYLQDLGVQVIYLNPVFVSPSNHKYDIQDYDYIDPHFGKIVSDEGDLLWPGDKDNTRATRYIDRVTNKANLEASNELFIHLVEEAHKRGMKVILDGVFNHCGSFNKWLDRERIYEAGKGYEPGAYVAQDSPYHTFFKFYNEHNWPYNEFYDGWWGHDTLPKLNYEGSEKLMEDIMRIGAKWVSPPFNADGWRLDVAADLGRSAGMNHQFWRDFRAAVKEANPEAVMIAEHYGSPYDWLKGDQWDTVMNYDAFMEPLSWFLTGMEKHSDEENPALFGDGCAFFEAMRYHMSEMPTASMQCAMNELSNHDHSRFMTRTNRRVGRLASAGAKAAEEGISYGIFRQGVVMQMTWPGAPTIYYGDEAGVCGWTDPDSRRTYPWGGENLELIEFHRYMSGIRKRCPAFRNGSLKELAAGDGYIAYGRFQSAQRAGGACCGVTAVNTGDDWLTLKIPVWQIGARDGAVLRREMMTYEDGYNAGQVEHEVKDGYIEVKIPPVGSIVLTGNDTAL